MVLGDVLVLFRTVSLVVQRRCSGKNVCRNAYSPAGKWHRGHGKDVGTGRVYESSDQGDVSNEPDIGGNRTDIARRMRVFRIQSPSRSKYNWKYYIIVTPLQLNAVVWKFSSYRDESKITTHMHLKNLVFAALVLFYNCVWTLEHWKYTSLWVHKLYF